MAIAAYRRVSTTHQSDERQRNAIESRYDVERWFSDTTSGKNRVRPGLDECLGWLREGDELVVMSLDRLGRSTQDLLTLIDAITSKGAKVTFVKEGLSFSRDANDHFARLMMTTFAAFAEFERNIMLERQREGIKLAKDAGKYARQPKLNRDQIQQAQQWVDEGVSKSEVARRLQCSRQTLAVALTGRGSYSGELR